MTTNRRRYWVRILIANAAGAFAVVGINGGFRFGARWPMLLRQTGVALVYANCIGTSMAIALPRVAHLLVEHGYRHRWTVLVATMVLLTAIGTTLSNVILLGVGVIPRRAFSEWLVNSFEISIIISLIIGISVTLYESLRSELEHTTVALRTKERDEAEARHLATEAELASLESRVDPHFLFNTLNSIAELTHDDPAGAERMTGQLASLMRSSLAAMPKSLVPLEQEIRVVRDYLDIERVRFGERLRYTIDVEEEASPVLVPRFSLQTLVENSVKYAVSVQRDGARIVVRAVKGDGRVRITVQDDGPGFDEAAMSGGHGLSLLRSRLLIVYGDRASLRADGTPGQAAVVLDIPADSQEPG